VNLESYSGCCETIDDDDDSAADVDVQNADESDLKDIISSSQQQVRRFQQLLSEERSLSLTSDAAGL